MSVSSRGFGRLALAAAVCMAASACEGSTEAGSAPAAAPPPGAVERPSPPAPPPRPRPGAPRVVRVVGEQGPGSRGPLRVGDEVAHDARLESGEATVVLDFPGGGRVELGPGTVASVGTEAGAQVFVGRGGVRGSVSVTGGSTRPALRIGTPAGTVAISAAGDILVRARADGTTSVSVLAGSASASRGNEGEGGRPVEEIFQQGRAARLGADRIASERGATTLEEARARMEGAGSEAPLTAAATAQLIDTRRGELEACLGRLEDLVARGEALRQRGPVSGGPALTARRAEVVDHAQRLGRLRRTCRIRYEMLRAADLLAGGTAPVVVDRERVRRLLGLP